MSYTRSIISNWKAITPMKTTRADYAITTINDTIFACGGFDASIDRLSSCEKFDGNWNWIMSLPEPIDDHCMVAISNSTILSIGGYDDSIKAS